MIAARPLSAPPQEKPLTLKIALIGSRYFAATVFETLRQEAGVTIAAVVAPAADDRLALAARAAGVAAVHVLENPKLVPGDALPDVDLIVAAHTHARVSNEALAHSRLGGVGYHPSLLPRHRGIAAVEWTVLQGDAIAGGSVYHLADGWDAGAIAAQDWCFVGRGENARELWERALAPLGLKLLAQVVRHARDHGALPAHTQDPRFATRAPMLRRTVKLADEPAPANADVVVTVMGPDRPGIVARLADVAHRHGANWAASRLSRLAGEFAGTVHLEVPPDRAEALSAALRELQTAGLQITIAHSAASSPAAGWRGVTLDLVGADRAGIVSQLTRCLAERGVSIEQLHTEKLGAADGSLRFKVSAQLLVPQAVANATLSADLQGLASEMMLDIALGDRAAG
jgi:glycine cleavage system regulatory protein/folate-dependent phosphoribosylglycinamide formyltransferase PurN